ncbi:ribonuclease HII [Candidatus Woesearchaeota archaeon CG07_land_8_20_14_0_80_44_23]|nr:MAG: ribonuclease HII [Candidatus Woesearchaeota archaeon CG07_land_8_20_14_0_80_44_23]
MAVVCGIDEAGRGPVIGPMVICGACFEKAQEKVLKKMGVKDSKLLSSAEREALFEKIKETCKGRYYAIIVSPSEIDAVVSENDLNWLEARKTAEIINFLSPDEAIIDCPNPNCQVYENYIKKRLAGIKVKITAEHKADFNYAFVGAASVLAKVIRDREIEKMKSEMKIDFGSGYPSDPLTKAFIEKNWEKKAFSEIIRKSWAPVRERREQKAQKKIMDF